ncbi:hypothetical protein A3SI_12064 [Nitritalea halalkaliphila LW7]|uniref:Uncharacterized protein n=1 Tax=Nitritalea halalkaliphila LW7 TaxID=1189621 RepID=I5C1Z8_9BACT|nr:tetratricopeptide repeat protein [Nitritalea halalkaliphila]EIM75850.1 hypothetical protein A3SI_12064 [Nitritalea halalkaliphila LW7]
MKYLSIFFLLLLLVSSCGESKSSDADSLFAAGQFDKAIEAYTDYLKTKPKHVKSLYNRGRAYEELGDIAKAESDFKAALDADNKNVQVMLALSNLYHKQKNYSNALLYAEYASEVSGAPVMVYFMKGRALHMLGNTDQALKEYSTAIKMDKDFAQAYYNRGMLKVATENRKGACDDFRQAARLNFDGAQQALADYCS